MRAGQSQMAIRARRIWAGEMGCGGVAPVFTGHPYTSNSVVIIDLVLAITKQKEGYEFSRGHYIFTEKTAFRSAKHKKAMTEEAERPGMSICSEIKREPVMSTRTL